MSVLRGGSSPSRSRLRRSSVFAVVLIGTISVWADQTTTVRGEIADTYCFGARGIRGPAHTACALRCAKKGIPLALIDEGNNRIYLLLPPKDESSMPSNVVAAAGTVRTVTGRIFMKGGTRFLTVDSIR